MISGMFIMSFSKSLVAKHEGLKYSHPQCKYQIPPPPKKARQIWYQSDIIYYSKLILIRVNCKLHF